MLTLLSALGKIRLHKHDHFTALKSFVWQHFDIDRVKGNIQTFHQHSESDS